MHTGSARSALNSSNKNAVMPLSVGGLGVFATCQICRPALRHVTYFSLAGESMSVRLKEKQVLVLACVATGPFAICTT